MVYQHNRSFGRLFLVALLFAATAMAQGLSSILGTVADPSGAAVANATIELTQSSTGQKRTVSADAQGNYLIPALQPSSYDLKAEAPGFQQFRLHGIIVLADQTATIKIPMQIGANTETVTVEASAALVDTVSGTQKQVVNQTQMVELPLNGRNAAQLSFLVAGAAPSLNGGALQGVSKVFPSQIVVSTNGIQQDQVSYELDGGTYNDELYSVNQPFPFPDALQEFSVQTSKLWCPIWQQCGRRGQHHH